MDLTTANSSLCFVLGAAAGNTSLSEVSKCWDCEGQFGSNGELFDNLTSSTNCTECLQNVCSEFVTEKNWYWAQAMVPVATLMGISMMLGIPGNVIVLVVYYFKAQKTSANKFMMALASIDLHACLVIHPYIISKLFNFYNPVPVVCKIFEYMIYVSQASQGLTLVAVAVDRYHAVMKPLAYRYADKAAYIIPLCFSIGAAASIPIILSYGQKTVWLYDQQMEYYIRTHVCHYSDVYDGSSYQFVYTITTLILLLLVVMAISVLYIQIAARLRRRNAMVGQSGIAMIQLDSFNGNSKKQDRGTKQSLETLSAGHLNEQGKDVEIDSVRQYTTIAQHNLIVRGNDINLITALEDEPIAHSSSSAAPVRIIDLEDEPIAHSSSSAPPMRITALEEEPIAHSSSTAPPVRTIFKICPSIGKMNVPRDQALRVHGTNLTNPNPARFKGSKLLFIVTLVFFLSWLPFWVLRFVESAEGKWEDIRLTNTLLSHLFFLNNAVNPILYAFLNRQFREEYKLTKKKISTRIRYLCC